VIIEIDAAVAHDRESMRSLERIALKIEDGWHLWEVEGAEGFENTPWLQDLGQAGERARDLLRAAIKRSGYPPGVHRRRVRVTLQPQREDEIKPEDAAHLAEAPMEVLVENRFGDGAFIRRIVAELDRELNNYWHAYQRGVKIDSVGGKGQMADEVERRCNGVTRPRYVVVVDSDQRAPASTGATPSIEASRLKKKCDEYRVPCWVLAKREAENYLPRVLLKARRDSGAVHQHRVDAWDCLSEDQKDFYDMKEGFPENPTQAEVELFECLVQWARNALESGFGSHVDKCWEIWSAQAKEALRERGRGDLEKGLELLRSEV
jgi:hypothetical protein